MKIFKFCTHYYLGVPEITKDSASEANYSEEDDPSRRGRGMPLHHNQHRYGPQIGQQGLPGTHRPGRMGGPAGRPQDPYYDQPGSYRNISNVCLSQLIHILFILRHRKSKR